MIRALFPNDELRLPGHSQPRWQVIDSHQRYGKIKLLDCTTHQERYTPLEEIEDDIIAGRLVVTRRGAPTRSVAAQNDGKRPGKSPCPAT